MVSTAKIALTQPVSYVPMVFISTTVVALVNVQTICYQSIIKHVFHVPTNSLTVPHAYRIVVLLALMVNLLITYAYLALMEHLMLADLVAPVLQYAQPANLKLTVQLASKITIC